MKKHPLQHLTNKSLAKIRDDNYFAPRIYHKAAHGKQGPRYLIKCGCCEQKLEIYYDRNDLEINGVLCSLESWREILFPLLDIKTTKKA